MGQPIGLCGIMARWPARTKPTMAANVQRTIWTPRVPSVSQPLIVVKNHHHVSACREQRHAADHGCQQQHEQKHEWPIPPSAGDDLIQPRIDARKPLADRRELLPAHMKPVEQ